MTPLEAEQLKSAALTILLREARDSLNPMFKLLMDSNRSKEAFERWSHLGTSINRYAKNETAASREPTGGPATFWSGRFGFRLTTFRFL